MAKPIQENLSLSFQERGFTLIEVLIGLFIFAWLSVASYQTLNQIIFAQKQLQAESEKIKQLQRFNLLLSKDFRQMVSRPINTSGLNSNYNTWAVTELEELIIEFTRSGWSNPLSWPRSELQRIRYTLGFHPDYDEPDSIHYKDDTIYLLRYIWRVLDRTEESEPAVQALIPDVVAVELEFYAKDSNEWLADINSAFKTSNFLPDHYKLPGGISINLLFEDSTTMNYTYIIQ